MSLADVDEADFILNGGTAAIRTRHSPLWALMFRSRCYCLRVGPVSSERICGERSGIGE